MTHEELEAAVARLSSRRALLTAASRPDEPSLVSVQGVGNRGLGYVLVDPATEKECSPYVCREARHIARLEPPP